MKLRFGDKAKLGYAIVALLLGAGLAVSIRRLTAMADGQIAYLRGQENEITQVERLRWSAELIVSHGRGYLISASGSLLAAVQEAEARFDQNVRALRRDTISPQGGALVADVERAADRFRETQKSLFAARQLFGDPERVIRRFETELRPLRLELGRAVDRLVQQEEAALARQYDDAKRSRRALANQLYGLLVMLVLAGLGVAWAFARLLDRSYRQEHEALEAARRAIRTRDDMMGIVAHDLRNPLGAITMKAALMKKTATSDKVRKDADGIQNVAARMEVLIKSLLDVATLEAGRFSLSRAPCGVEDLMRETADLFSHVAASKQVRLEADAGEHGLTIDADRNRVLQVLSNLVGNALKFTPGGGQVKVVAQRQQDVARFAVSDTGPGIAEVDVPRLFDRFWKGESAGTGLGLFIAKGIVEAHGGRIWVKSRPGEGTTFFFEVQLARPSLTTASRVVTKDAAAHGAPPPAGPQRRLSPFSVAGPGGREPYGRPRSTSVPQSPPWRLA